MEANGRLTEIVEALLFASDEPLTDARIRACIDGAEDLDVGEAIRCLNETYRESGRAFEIVEVAGGYQMVTLPEYEDWLSRLFASRRQMRLSRPALETLSIIAYRQPISRPIIEAVRGVDCSGVLHTLLARNLVVIAGREATPGRPLLYKTSKEFLRYFGLNELDELPRLREIEELTGEPPR